MSEQKSKKAFGKERRRNAQAQKVEQKNKENADFFWQCAQTEKINREKGIYKKPSEASKKTLFARQESSGINFSQYDKIEVTRSGPEGCEAIPEMDNFLKLKSVLPKFLADNLTNADRMGYSVPTPIQRHCVPLSLTKTFDVMACAQTGSGKTVAFLVPLITQITASLASKKKDRGRAPALAASPSALIVSPTRELALQIELEAHKLTYQSPIQCVCVYGGASSTQQLALLAKGVDILIATPGRLNDFLSQRLITLSRTHFCVLDEADRMLDMGFEPQIRQICEQHDLPPASSRNTLMFSATFPVEVQKIAQKYMRPYVFVAVGRVGSTVSSITQKVVHVRANDKRLKLETVIPLIVSSDKTIIFCQKKHVATWLKNQLVRAHGIALRVDAIHGDRSQSQREHALELFRDGKLDVLVATDVAARGLDVPGINHVIQFDLPVSVQDFDNYVHRIGRTGRAGRLGVATALFVPGQDAKLGQNGALLEPLCELLVEGKQEVPQWLSALRGGRAATGQQQPSRNGGAGSSQQLQQGQRQGQAQVKAKQPQRDARSKSNVVTVSSAVISGSRAASVPLANGSHQQSKPQPKAQQPKPLKEQQQQQQQQPLTKHDRQSNPPAQSLKQQSRRSKQLQSKPQDQTVPQIQQSKKQQQQEQTKQSKTPDQPKQQQQKRQQQPKEQEPKVINGNSQPQRSTTAPIPQRPTPADQAQGQGGGRVKSSPRDGNGNNVRSDKGSDKERPATSVQNAPSAGKPRGRRRRNKTESNMALS
mmetsp:Transcript_14494/g.24041  ORF Transcript_14494/g.24041 Transcript_14494/m.24041 type:complete len:765 (-) Transcript_14494:267-2561(-)